MSRMRSYVLKFFAKGQGRWDDGGGVWRAYSPIHESSFLGKDFKKYAHADSLFKISSREYYCVIRGSKLLGVFI